MSKPLPLSKKDFLKVFGVAADKMEDADESRDYVACLSLYNALSALNAHHATREAALIEFFAFYMKPENKIIGDRWFGEHMKGCDAAGFPIYIPDKKRIQNQRARATALRMMQHMINTSPGRYYKQYLQFFKKHLELTQD